MRSEDYDIGFHFSVMANGRPIHRRIDTWIFLVLWAFTIAPGAWATRDLDWPYDADGFRDVAIAQHARDGQWLGDPFYAHEAAWYSPLVPAVAAVTSAVLGVGTPETYCRLGAWLNALAPFAFWAFVRSACGVWPALFAATAFMFLPGRPPAWASATYSPWLFPSVTAQIPFYAALTLIVRINRSAALRQQLVLGLLLAVTFLAHAAAGMVLGSIAVAAWCWRVGGTARTDRGRQILGGLVALATAALLVAPFLLPIATRYGFQVLNRAPATWSDGSTTLAGLIDYTRAGSMAQWIVAIYGAAQVLRLSTATRIVAAVWGLTSAAALIYAQLAEARPGWPTLVPAFHFFFLLRAWMWVLFGCGLAAIAERLALAVARRVGGRLRPSTVIVAVVGAMSLSVYPRYLGREAFTTAPETSRRLAQTEDRAAYKWIRANTPSSAVFLSDDEDALRITGPAGRWAVSVSPAFSNPYVSYEARAAARDRMLKLAAAGDHDAFGSLARAFGVTHLLARSELAGAIRMRRAGMFEETFAAGTLVVFRVAD